VGEALEEFKGALTGRLSKGMSLADAVLEVVREAVPETKAIRFEGNNYATEWVEEAQRRGLPNLRTTPEALAELVRPEARTFLARAKVFSEAESDARYHVKLERYLKDIEVEVEALNDIVNAHVLPAAYKQLALLAGAGSSRTAGASRARLESTVDELSDRLAGLHSVAERAAAEASLEKRAHLLAQETVPAMAGVREMCDRIEESVADEFWTLPKYGEMLFLV
jgi:glutamine synthetase